jgi:hypothetical protein
MLGLATDLQAVKVTTDPAGLVWYLDGLHLPQPTRLSVDEFLKQPLPWGPARLVRAPGMARNARLLLAIYREIMAGNTLFSGLEVCSPLCCVNTEQRNDPAVLLFKTRSFDPPVSVGGWHSFGPEDLRAYLLAYFQQNELPGDQDDVAEVLHSHPAWRALSFVAGLNTAAAAQLLGLIIDPRWYIDPADPDQTNKLPQFLGLDPRAQAQQTAGNIDPGGRAERNRLVLSCWKTGEPPQPTELRPGQFLWKVWYAKGGGARGDLAASKRLVDYLRQTWTAALCRGAQAARLFVPEFFFGAASPEAVGFRKHLAGV